MSQFWWLIWHIYVVMVLINVSLLVVKGLKLTIMSESSLDAWIIYMCLLH